MSVFQDKWFNAINNKATFDWIPLLTKSQVVLFYLTVNQQRNIQLTAVERLLWTPKTWTWHQTQTNFFSVHHAERDKAMSEKFTSLEEDNIQCLRLSFHSDCFGEE